MARVVSFFVCLYFDVLVSTYINLLTTYIYLLPHLLPGPTSPSVCSTGKSGKSGPTSPSCGKSGKSNGSGNDCDPGIPEGTDAPSSPTAGIVEIIPPAPTPFPTPQPTPEATVGSSETVAKGTESEPVPFVEDRED